MGFVGGSSVQAERIYAATPEQLPELLSASCIICTSPENGAADLLYNSHCDYLILDGGMSLGQVYETVFSVFERYNQYEQRLTQALTSEHALSSFLNVVSETFHTAVLLVDGSFRVLRYNTNYGRAGISCTCL